MDHAGSSEERRWLGLVPKVELHLHLEGAIPLDALWQLIGKYGGDPQVPTREALGDRFDVRAYHDLVLTNGSLPLFVLEAEVDRWIEKQKAL